MGLVLALMVINNFKQQTQMENKQFDITKVAIKSDGTRERGEKIIEFFEKHGVKNPAGLEGSGEFHPFYMTNKRGEIDHYAELNGKTLIDLPPDILELPCVMEVWDDDESDAVKRFVLWINPDKNAVHAIVTVSKHEESDYKKGLPYSPILFKHCKPIPENPKRIRKMQLLEKVKQLENEIKQLRDEAEQI
jgi:hypothetical protein